MSETTVHAVELKQELQAQVQDHLKDLKDNGAILEYYRAKYRQKLAAAEKGPGTSDNSRSPRYAKFCAGEENHLGSLDLTKSIEELEGDYWGTPNFQSSLVIRCYELRRKQLNQFSIEDLRIMIGQNKSLKILLPLAIKELQRDLMAQGDYYPGDLLKAVLSVDREHWKACPNEHAAVSKLISTVQLPGDPEFKKAASRFLTAITT